MDDANKVSLGATATAAGLDLADDRLELLAQSAERVGRVLATLAAIDYGTAEPAARFRPAPRRRAS